MEAASVEAVQKQFAGSVRVVGVAWAGDDASYGDFISRHGLTFPNIEDTVGEIYRRYGVAGQPAWAFVGRDGSVDVTFGAYFESDLARILTDLAAE